jgi:predicted Zn finger-like uncharacterized protein
MPQTRCGHWETTYRVAESQMGKSVRCKKCGKAFTIVPFEEADEVPVLEASPEPTRPEPTRPEPTRRRTPPVPPSLPSKARQDDRDSSRRRNADRDEREERDEAPRPRRKRSREDDKPAPSSSPVKYIVLGVSAVLVLGAVGTVVALTMTNRSGPAGGPVAFNLPVVPRPCVGKIDRSRRGFAVA